MSINQTVRQSMLASRLSAQDAKFFLDNSADADSTVVVRGPLPIIHNPFGSRIQIGAHTVVNSANDTSFVSISSPVKFALGRDAVIVIGNHCDLNGCAISAYERVEIGDHVQIGPSTWITDTDLHPIDLQVRRNQLEGIPYDLDLVGRAPVRIGNDVWIGAGVYVLKGVSIGRGSIVGAGSVVTKNIPPDCVVAGNPARVIRTLAIQIE